MSFIKRARRATVSKAGVAFVAALALGTTSAAIWAATTANASTPDTIWGSSAPSFAPVDSDTGSVELGTTFTAVSAGQATGVRFYKTPENRGNHTGSLWTSTGTLIGKVTFGTETSSGWQIATFAQPVALSAGTSYVVSYHASYGRYLDTEGYTGASTSANLRIPSSNVGVYAYGTTSSFPTETWHASNYWVDLTFVKGAAGSTSTPVSGSSGTSTPVSGSSSTATQTPSAATSTTTPSASSTASVSTTTASASSSAPTASALSVTAQATASAVTTKASTTNPTASSSSSGSSASGLTNCVSLPSRCGYPDATNTGVPAGTTLTRVPQDRTSGTGWTWDSRGWISTTDNAIVENLIIDGHVETTGKNVTVRNNRILQTGEDWAVALRTTVNATVTHNTIGVTGAPRLMVGVKDIYGDSTGTTVSYNDISNASTGIQMYAGLVENNYIHDLGMNDGDHINGFTSNLGTDPLTIRNNTILNKFNQTDAISLFQDFGVEGNRLITGNLVAGGGYTIYGGDGSFGKTFNIQITNNRFSRIYYPNGGSYGPLAHFDNQGADNLWSGNYWDEDESPIV
jgi:Domain of unknown function (DUF4082)